MVGVDGNEIQSPPSDCPLHHVGGPGVSTTPRANNRSTLAGADWINRPTFCHLNVTVLLVIQEGEICHRWTVFMAIDARRQQQKVPSQDARGNRDPITIYFLLFIR